MKLITSPTTPFGRKVGVILREKQLAFELVPELPWEPTTKASEYNPLGKVPALITSEGETFFDSPVIVEYIETLNASPRFIPTYPLDAVRVRQIEALADGITDAGVVVFFERKRDATQQKADWITRHLGKIQRGLDFAETKLAGKTWFYGEQMTVADIAMACSILWLEYRLPDTQPRQRTALAELVARLEKRPSFLATQPPVA